ncbi:hypothetical protein E2C01_017020 [Portunus trituberculatus]|uniref:Uncharacterized protein n=1 Tax=Portunus trituberculatus TaxID=210409 RepID=A0A5B7DQJ4_PORTR|nr:hypothetical protein [Portunus trituberculatus]
MDGSLAVTKNAATPYICAANTLGSVTMEDHMAQLSLFGIGEISQTRLPHWPDTQRTDEGRGTMRALGSEGSQTHGFESCLRSECRLGFLTQGKGFLAVGL